MLAGLAWAAVNLPGWARFRAALARPEQTQQALLRSYLERQRDFAERSNALRRRLLTVLDAARPQRAGHPSR